MQTILFTTDEEVLERIARHDPLYQEDVVESARAESASSRAAPPTDLLETVSAAEQGVDGADEQSPLDRPHTSCSRVAAATRRSGTAASQQAGRPMAGAPPPPPDAAVDPVFRSRPALTSASNADAATSRGDAFTFQSTHRIQYSIE